jgi:hypothetical protein
LQHTAKQLFRQCLPRILRVFWKKKALAITQAVTLRRRVPDREMVSV